MESTMNIAAFNEVADLAKDLQVKTSQAGHQAIVNRINDCIAVCGIELEKMLKTINDLEAKNKELNDKLLKPYHSASEFNEIAKTLNFPDLSPVVDGDVKNPNIETSFEDPVPDADITFAKSYLQEKPDDIVLSKEEQLTESEISAYTNESKLSELAKQEMACLSHPSNVDDVLSIAKDKLVPNKPEDASSAASSSKPKRRKKSKSQKK